MIDPDVEDLLNDLRPLLVTAFQRGFRAGQADMRESILRAANAQAAVPENEPAPPPGTLTGLFSLGANYLAQQRKPTAVEAITDILTANPGLNKSQIIARIPHGMFSPHTVANALSSSGAFGRHRRQWFVKDGERLVGFNFLSTDNSPQTEDDDEDHDG